MARARKFRQRGPSTLLAAGNSIPSRFFKGLKQAPVGGAAALAVLSGLAIPKNSVRSFSEELYETLARSNGGRDCSGNRHRDEHGGHATGRGPHGRRAT